jgi:hypothetical protein
VEADKKKWIDEVFNSTNGMRRAKPGGFLFPKILNKLRNPDKAEVYISRKKVALGFLTIVLLGLLNAGTILFKNDAITQGSNSKSVIEEYFPSSNRSIDKIFNQ